MASMYGHPAETHQVTTEDGYILTLFRLYGNRKALPVLLFHGILDSSDTWIIRGNRSLSINLANNNYDVWLGNVRGNRYSQGHVYLNRNVDPAYWNFSFNEHGLYDLSATIDYILTKTGAPKLNMFGHSQGNILMWVLLSTRTQYNDKINVATALAPVCYGAHVLEPVPTLLRVLNRLYPLLRALGVTNVLGDNSILTILFRLVARIPVLGYFIDAYKILFTVFGRDSTELEPSFLPTVTLHVPTWTSLKNVIHYAQVVMVPQFARFDYGPSGNLAAYNSTTPPLYELGNVKTKVVLLAALNDKLSQLGDVDTLRKQLPNVIECPDNETPV
ncbi:lipase 1-like [Epargyreus clarus]|uniref:lipase 1-like n=1 Tax=Epargyreus clarus TaxID=520877 RepID=UPI003C2BBBBF